MAKLRIIGIMLAALALDGVAALLSSITGLSAALSTLVVFAVFGMVALPAAHWFRRSR